MRIAIWLCATLLATLAPTGGAGAAAASDDCLTTYDRKGHVTGRWCPDGSSGPAAAETAVPAQPRHRASGKAVAGTGQQAARPAPGVTITCTGRGGRCRGSFDLSR